MNVTFPVVGSTVQAPWPATVSRDTGAPPASTNRTVDGTALAESFAVTSTTAGAPCVFADDVSAAAVGR